MRQRGGLPAWVFWLMFAGLIAEITTILLLIPEADMSIEETPCTESLADLTGQSELPQVKAEPPVKTQCTESEGHSMRCLNPLCNNPVISHTEARTGGSSIAVVRANRLAL